MLLLGLALYDWSPLVAWNFNVLEEINYQKEPYDRFSIIVSCSLWFQNQNEYATFCDIILSILNSIYLYQRLIGGWSKVSQLDYRLLERFGMVKVVLRENIEND